MRRLARCRTLLAAAAATTLAGVAAGSSGPVAAAAEHGRGSGTLSKDAEVEVVAEGLYSPRSLAWGPRGRLLVSETGKPPLTAPSECNMESEEIVVEMKCFGFTGSVADISSGKPRRIVENLPSALNLQDMIGPNGLAYSKGRLYTLQAGAPQAIPDDEWLSDGLRNKIKPVAGTLMDVTNPYRPRVVARPGEASYDYIKENPDPTPDFDVANPYSLIPRKRGGFYYVDAAANVLGKIDRWGRTEILTGFPPSEAGSDAVPTCVAEGRDRAVYVGTLTGHGNTGEEGAKAAKVYRYEPWSGDLEVWQEGFSAITGCGFGKKGDFYVTQATSSGFLPSPDDEGGSVIQIARDGTRTELAKGELFFPHGFLAGRDGSIYVTNKCLWWPPGTTGDWDGGEVIKIG
ncbi:ScyD/ScyE family protein [Streptomyces synnematoformans]|uniref:ScyD/ScyE family protein n=1 Tax=Streptomyces synnematoformans TaxID=415721 RepID=A0ABP5KC05_9ACTN